MKRQREHYTPEETVRHRDSAFVGEGTHLEALR
jgi:hypothetical protein